MAVSERPLHIALALRSYRQQGGTEKYVVDLARWLSGRGHRVDVWAAEVDPALRADPVTFRPLHGGKGLPGALRLSWSARGLQDQGYDVVQGFGRTLHHDVFRAGGGAHAAFLEATCRTPWSRLRARLSPRERLHLALDRRAMQQARAVVCNSRMGADDVCRAYGLARERVHVIRNGVDSERFRPDPDLRRSARAAWGVDEGRVALFLGTGFRRKGLDVAIAAFRTVARPEDALVVLGRDGRAERFLGPARAALGRRLIALGEVRDPERWLPGADAMILPTRYDPAANAVLEALACGVPPITTHRDGNAEIVPDPALVAPVDDVAATAAALRRAWDGGPALGRRCREEALSWPVARNGAAVETLYRELANEQTR